MKIGGTVQGIKGLVVSIAQRDKILAARFAANLLKAGLFLQRESMKIVPVDTGALRASANTRAEGSGFDRVVIVSYGTTYGLWVHEDKEARHAPGKRAKFLEYPFREKRQRLIRIIRTGK